MKILIIFLISVISCFASDQKLLVVGDGPLIIGNNNSGISTSNSIDCAFGICLGEELPLELTTNKLTFEQVQDLVMDNKVISVSPDAPSSMFSSYSVKVNAETLEVYEIRANLGLNEDGISFGKNQQKWNNEKSLYQTKYDSLVKLLETKYVSLNLKKTGNGLSQYQGNIRKLGSGQSHRLSDQIDPRYIRMEYNPYKYQEVRRTGSDIGTISRSNADVIKEELFIDMTLIYFDSDLSALASNAKSRVRRKRAALLKAKESDAKKDVSETIDSEVF